MMAFRIVAVVLFISQGLVSLDRTSQVQELVVLVFLVAAAMNQASGLNINQLCGMCPRSCIYCVQFGCGVVVCVSWCAGMLVWCQCVGVSVLVVV